ncbi:THAP domain-containing protein 5-like [Rhipicephalus sanguineus]|uniref:THAP domain-containing protein 5-like n=1 Tax=Rhipicephalus sanguineus TaxID=34632 RepID=UPI001895ACD6|nr:THAP domain-containing protein 5-like [Rhipicephalus sanguineus]
MPLRCSAIGCGKRSVRRNRPCHVFPTEPELRKMWIRAARPSQPTWVPSKHDFLCSEHFEDSDYNPSYALLLSFGLPAKRRRLKPGTIPTIFSRKETEETNGGIEAACEKRRRSEIIHERPEEENLQHAVPVASNCTVSLEDSFTNPVTGISTQQKHCHIEQLIHAGEMHDEDREETMHISDLLQINVFSNGQTDFSKEREHPIEFHDEHQDVHRASENMESGNTSSTAFVTDSEGQKLRITLDVAVQTTMICRSLGMQTTRNTKSIAVQTCAIEEP